MLKKMRTIGVILLLIVGYYAFSWAMSYGKRQDSKSFFIAVSAGNYGEAREYLSPKLANFWTESKFESEFGGIKPFTSVRLPFSGNVRSESTVNFSGWAETASGCTSDVFISLDNVSIAFFIEGDGIEKFEITPLCFD